jgi:type 1 glutamine amidotransferase
VPTIDYRAPLNVLVAVRGHPFDRTAFDAVFSEMDGITATMVDQPAAAQLMNLDGMAPYQALVLYDMPGLDFDAAVDKPGYVNPGPRFREGFCALLQAGKGVVALHHALAGWPAWPDYADLLGGCFRYRAGAGLADSGYRHEVTYTAEVAAPDHPVMQGVPPSFEMHDELYLADVFEDRVTPLLRARHAFNADGFFSAQAAMAGRINDNAEWERPAGSNVIGWAKDAGGSRLVYLQPGHDHHTYNNPWYRRMVENAIRWVVERKEAVLF